MKPNFTDERGTITDLIVTPDYSITHITFNDGAVRGNHYHKHTKQIDHILKGKLICNQDGKELLVSSGQIVVHDENVRHAYKAVEYSEISSTCFGIRKGADYENDVIRLNEEEKLIK